jgi:hypothetical protein
MSDTPTTNWATLNPILGLASNNAPLTYRNGNLEAGNNTSGSYNSITFGTFGVSSGKWYFEVTVGTSVVSPGISTTTATTPFGTGSYQYYGNGNKYIDGAVSSYGATFTTNDVIGVAFDLDAGTLVFYKNNVSQGTAATGLSGTFVPSLSHGNLNSSYQVFNFGQRAFAYTPPTGYKALNTANLPEPTIADGSTAMDVLLWTGTGTGADRTISGLNFTNAPGFIWGKSRSGAYHHTLWDVVRGYGQTNVLSSDRTEGQGWTASGRIKTAAASSITWEADSGSLWYDGSSTTYAAWCWDAGSSTVTNTAGSITSTVSANPTAGFSIATYTGTGSNASVGHGLGVTPSMCIIKQRNTAQSWWVWHQALGNNVGANNTMLELNGTAGTYAADDVFRGFTPTVFQIGTDSGSNTNGGTYVAYCFAEVEGYSKIGSYVGNGSTTDGPFIWCGFTPRWILCKWYKDVSSAESWHIYDTVRQTYNANNTILQPDSAGIEETPADRYIDILSNGFKLRQNGQQINRSGASYIFMALAEHPTGGANVSPATAR